MRGGALGSLDDFGGIGIVLQAGNIFGNRAVKKGDTLGQIPKIAAQNIRIVMIKAGPIQTHIAPCWPPNPNQRPRQR